MKTFLVVLRLEALSLLRTREVYTFGILPAVFLVPVGLGLGLGIASFFPGSDVLAIPVEDPDGIALTERLGRFDLLRTDDPRGALEAGLADVAVVGWGASGEEGAWVHARVLASAEGDEARLQTALSRHVAQQLDQRIVEAGGAGRRDRVPAVVLTPRELGFPLDLDLRQLLVISYTFVTAYLSCFLIPVRTAAERLSGVLEAMATTATPVGVVYTARALVSTVLFLVLGGIAPASVWLLVGPELQMDVRPLDLVEAGATLLLLSGLFLGCGLVANSVRTALYVASYLILGALPLLGVSLFLELPQVPLLGFAREGWLGWQLLRIAGTVALTVGCLVGVSWLASGDRVLPRGQGDD